MWLAGGEPTVLPFPPACDEIGQAMPSDQTWFSSVLGVVVTSDL